MSCRKAFDIDLAGFLSEPGREEFAEFREHYPVCPECTAEVRAWTDLHVLLQSGAAVPNGGHPEPQLLLRYEQGEERLEAAAVADLERHLAGCASCRDELTALRRFDFSVVDARAPRGLTARERVAILAGRVRTLFVHPAFAYALVLVLLYPAAMSYFSGSNAPSLFPMRSADEPMASQLAPAAEAAPEEADRVSRTASPGGRTDTLEKGRAGHASKEAAGRLPAEPARSLTAAVPSESFRGEASGPRFAEPEPLSERLAPAGTQGAQSELLEVRKRAARLQDVPGKRGEEEARAAPGASSYRAAPAPPQAGIEGAGELERPAADVHDAPQIQMMRGTTEGVQAKARRPPWALRLKVPDEVRAATRFEVRVVHRDGRREVRQRFETAEAGEEVDVVLPLNWLPSNDDLVEFQAIP